MELSQAEKLEDPGEGENKQWGEIPEKGPGAEMKNTRGQMNLNKGGFDLH